MHTRNRYVEIRSLAFLVRSFAHSPYNLHEERKFLQYVSYRAFVEDKCAVKKFVLQVMPADVDVQEKFCDVRVKPGVVGIIALKRSASLKLGQYAEQP